MEEKLECLTKTYILDEDNANNINKYIYPDEFKNTDLNAFNNNFFDINRPFKVELNTFKYEKKTNNFNNTIKLSDDLDYKTLNVIRNENEFLNLDLLKLETIKDDILFTKNEIKSIEKLSKNVFRTKNYAFLKKKKKKKVKQNSKENSKSNLKDKHSGVKNHKYSDLKKKNANHEIKSCSYKNKDFNQSFCSNSFYNDKKFFNENNYKLNNKRTKTEVISTEKKKKFIFKIENHNNNKQDQAMINLSLVSNKICNKKTNVNLCDASKDPSNQESLLQSNVDWENNNFKNLDFLKSDNEENKKIKIKWTSDEDKKLIKIKHDFPYLSWSQVSQFFENRSKIDCMNRYLKVIDPNLKKGKWAKEEDQILKNWVSLNGEKNWFNLVKANLLQGRNCKQIRDRWINCLRPQLKIFEWTKTNENILLEKFLIYGSSWTKISAFIPNTSENIIKNKFYSMLRKTANKHLNESKKHKGSNDLKENNKIMNLTFESKHSLEFKEKNKDFNLDLIKELKNKNICKKKKFIEQDITDTYMNLNSSNTKTNTISHNTGTLKNETSAFPDRSEFESLLDVESDEGNTLTGSKKRKKNNYSLDSLMNFLPLLLKEKGISYEKVLESDKLKSSINKCSFSINNNRLNHTMKDETESDLKQKKHFEFLNTIKKPFDRKKEMIRKELINKIKRISNNKLLNKNTLNLNFEDKLNRVNSIINNNEFILERNFSCEKDNLMLNSYNNFNNLTNLNTNFGNFGNLNNKLHNLILSNNNLSNLNDSFISNGDDLLDNFFNNNLINLNFSNSDLQNNKNLSNSFNFSDLLDLENNNNNNNFLNSSNQSINRNNSFNNNLLENNNQNTLISNANPEPKQNSSQTFGRLNRMKSSIMLNLQLNLLNKIVEKIKNNYVQKFFLNFKNNTLFKVPNGVTIKNQINDS